MTVAGATAAASVQTRLDDVARRVRRAMLDSIPDREPNDWLYRLSRSYPARPGKAIRPALCLASCAAFGGVRDAEQIAVAIELLHNAFLVHDDVADGSERRRGRPTLAAEHGAGLAINAGDALAVLAQRMVRQSVGSLPPRLGERIHEEFDTMALHTLEGQALELGWRRSPALDLAPEDYLELIMHKTCWYTTIHPLRVGALLGSDGAADLRPMIGFGFHLGAAFQIRDDILNLVGDVDVYGKEIDGDLYEGKRTLMLIHLASEATGRDRQVVRRYLQTSRAERTDDLVATIRGLIDEYRSIDFALDFASGIAARAGEAFEEAFSAAPAGPDVDFVAGLIPYMLDRRS